MALHPALVTCCCCEKLPQTWSFKTTEICLLTVLEAKRLKSASLAKIQVSAGCTSSRGSRGGCVLPLLVSHSFWHSLACDHITPVCRASISDLLPAPSSHHLQLCVSAHMCERVCNIFLCLSLRKTFMMIFRAHLDHPGYSSISRSLSTSAKTLFFSLKNVTFIGSRDRWSCYSAHYTLANQSKL